jgi:peptidoglycan/LPS O-acetylase OafA/YrhL
VISRLLQPLRPPPAAPTVERDLALEGVRGGCAVLVFYAHLFLPDRVLDPLWSPSPRFAWFNLGYAAVLMFFVLSGYVIGLVTTQPATAAGIRHYLRHRTARLLPMNTLVVLLCWLLLAHPTLRTVVGNLLFLQNDDPYPVLGSFPVVANNPNLWSLNYEAVFYLGFIAIWVRAPRVGLVFGGMAVLVCAHALGFPLPRVIARYACGALYWLAGLTMAWMTTRPAAPPSRSNWPAAGLAAYALWTFAPLRSLCLEAGLFSWAWPAPTPMSPHRLDFLPACVWLLLAVTGRAPGAQRILAGICLGLATAGGLGRALAGHWQGLDTVAAAALLGAWVLLRREFSLRFLQRLAPLGVVSFGLYAVAAPLQLGQRALLPGFAGSGLTFAVRLVFVVALVAVIVWLLERRLCPPLGRWIRQRGRREARPPT